jgi:hypothetical protein
MVDAPAQVAEKTGVRRLLPLWAKKRHRGSTGDRPTD